MSAARPPTPAEDDLLAQVGGDQGSCLVAPAATAPREAAEPEAPAALHPPGAPEGPLSGAQWSGYRLGALLGAGGMGTVYRAWQRGTGRLVAFKVLSGEAAGDPQLRARFANEARAAAAVDAPQVVRVLDAGEHQGRLWLAMELVEGRTLAEELRLRAAAGHPFAPLAAAALARQAALGLAAAHALRLVHRDIKPANLMLGADGALKVADFGLVRRLDGHSLTRTGTMLGTPLYAAPEQGRGLATDARGDVYSLGAVLYELLTLRPPFRAETAEALVFQHNFAEPPLPAELNPQVPADLQAVCLRCLQKDPERRFADGAALAADLARVLDGLAPLAPGFSGRPSTGADEALRRLAGWRRRWWPVAGAALVCAAVAGGWWWWEARRGEQAALRQRLAPLAVAAPVPATASDDLARLAALAGGGDPLVRQGRARLAEVAELAARLAALEAGDEPGRAEQAAMRAGCARLAELVGRDGDPRLARWEAWAAAVDARAAALHARLAARFAGAELAGAALAAAAAGELAAYARLAGEDDRDLRAWRAAVQRGAAAAAAARAELAALEQPEPPGAEALARLEAAWGRMAALDPGEAALPAWRRRLDAEAAALAADRAALERLAGRDRLAPDESAAAAAALARLEARAALPAADAARWRDRLAARGAELAALRARLAALDRPLTPPEDAAALLARYEALAGLEDADAARWRARWHRVRVLQERLAPLDRAASEPADADAALAAYQELVGPDDPRAAAWRARLAAIAALRTRLAGLDRSGPEPAGAAADCAALARLVGGDDPALARWTALLAERAALAARLDALAGALALDPGALAAARAALARWSALAGDDDRAAAARRRLTELDPPPPAWSAACGRDRHGPWALLGLERARLRLRWLPPCAGAVGSPADEPGRRADESPARLRLTRGRWLAERECPQDLWRAVMGGDPARARGDDLPVESVSWDEAAAFCTALGARLGAAVRLPGEAEWELAMRAGAAGPWGALPADRTAAAVVHAGHRRAGPAPDEGAAANPIGLLHGPGNLWEWCADGYAPAAAADGAVDPPPAPGARRSARGGSWGDPLESCRLARRIALDPATRSCYLGFRFAIDPVEDR